MGVPAAWSELCIDDLPSDELRWIANEHGIVTAVSIWRSFAGISIRLPIKLPREFCIRYIRAHFPEMTVNQLARALGISTRTVQEYIGARPTRPADRRAPNPAQLALL